MKSFKPDMTIERAQHFLQTIESETVSDIAPIEMGELSKVFRYRLGAQSFVIHFKSGRETVDKVKLISERYSSVLPIPRMVKIGTCDGLPYTISEQAVGAPVLTQPKEEIVRVIPDLIERFAAMNQVRVDSASGYGWITPSGEGASASWTDWLASLFNEEQEGFYEGWTSLFESSFLEKDLFDRTYAAMIELAQYAPEERYLVHGDFHLGNMLSDDGRITAIVDWEMAMYGDFLFDAAVLHLWVPQIGFPQRLREHWERQGREIAHFEKRLLCYQLFKGLDGLRFYAKKDDKPSYDFMRSHLVTLLKQAE
ncbi:phosphotransferase family protein [Paenibacillus flagellatus]|uniref:Aminoglycoside phosphotransferase family protein n=1 Tax=Paenibacillus flagellatus TaxID=2211139 RepID=A0A2V5K1M7_9BACL|nr:aminoglycoside phosphotransferase family protein [Paenibacillus flagellatus]PYI53145.1 aminoglycoside phosphotransferase family protein [Paenibacillus flagellatus]